MAYYLKLGTCFLVVYELLFGLAFYWVIEKGKRHNSDINIGARMCNVKLSEYYYYFLLLLHLVNGSRCCSIIVDIRLF